jgi:hypothetical protein
MLAGERRSGEDGVHKTSTTAILHGCLPGGEGVLPRLQASLHRAFTWLSHWVWKIAAFLLAQGLIRRTNNCYIPNHFNCLEFFCPPCPGPGTIHGLALDFSTKN